MKKIIVAAALAATVSTPALAWGEKEQGIVAGIIGTLILQDIARGNTNPYPVPAPQPAPAPRVEHHYHYSNNCGTEIRTRYTDNGRRVIRDTVDRCTGRLLERRETWN